MADICRMSVVLLFLLVFVLLGQPRPFVQIIPAKLVNGYSDKISLLDGVGFFCPARNIYSPMHVIYQASILTELFTSLL